MNLLDAPFVIRRPATVDGVFLYISGRDGLVWQWTTDVNEAKEYPTYGAALADGAVEVNVVTLKQAREDAARNARHTRALATKKAVDATTSPMRAAVLARQQIAAVVDAPIGTTLAEAMRLQSLGTPDAPPTHMCKTCAALWWANPDGTSEARAYDHRPRGMCADGGCDPHDLLELPEYLRARKPATAPIQHWTPAAQKAAILAVVDGIVKNVLDAERFDDRDDRATSDVRAREAKAGAAAARDAADKGRETLDQVLTAVLS